MREQQGDAKYMSTAGTGWLRERRGRKNKASGSIGFRGAGNFGPTAGLDRRKSKIGDWRKNENTLCKQRWAWSIGGTPSFKTPFQWRCPVLELDHRVDWCNFQRCTTQEPTFSRDMSAYFFAKKLLDPFSGGGGNMWAIFFRFKKLSNTRLLMC